MAGPRDQLSGRCPVSTQAAVLGTVLALALAGCPGSTPPPAGDTDGGGPELDAPIVDREDTDGDGLCNDTEFARRTDPFDGDTDADGYSDWVEVVFGFDPLRPAEPDRAIISVLRESAGSETAVPVEVVVRGSGEDYTGGFEGLSARDPLGITASDFYAGSVALFANPEDGAAAIEGDAERFRVVVGITELTFEVRFEWGEDDLVRRCLRAYPWRYVVKRSDGRLVSATRKLLVVVPEGETISGGEWCVPEPPCT